MADSNSAPAPVGAKENTGTLSHDLSNPPPSRTDNQRGRSQGGPGGRGGRGGKGGQNKGNRKGFGSKDKGGKSRSEMGRADYNRQNIDKRERNNEQTAKRRKLNGGEALTSPFTKEEIEAEARQPKRKVAVMIGYAGSGYKGMQINSQEKTIEGDLFSAFIKAGAISKANANDPKKSSLVRCARTDKGVHAAGNVISLKLIVEDPNVVQNINEHLPAQIRVWGIERTNGSFSCYQTCDSRWYEYLIPTFSFIPPHPLSYLGQKLEESAKKVGVLDAYNERQEDALSFWETAEELYVKPILDRLDSDTAKIVMATIRSSIAEPDSEDAPKDSKTKQPDPREEFEIEAITKPNTMENSFQKDSKPDGDLPEPATLKNAQPQDIGLKDESKTEGRVSSQSPLEIAIKDVKAAYIKAKKAYRISEKRRIRVQETLAEYLGTKNFHNYTIQKTFTDPSAKRIIRSFNVGPKPVIINDTEWLSLKVHGQSFMMHQIRKMVAMAALVVRCGAPLTIIQDSYGSTNISIPKAPGLGLLLERPVFNSYNERAEKEYNRGKIDFNKYQKEMDEFKQREIYDRIFREEERDHQFHDFFHHLDHYRSDNFLWVTAEGIAAAKQTKTKNVDISDGEDDPNGGEG